MIHNLNISLEDLYLFYHVVHKGGFLKAAQAMNVCQGKASRRVAHIEQTLGVTLLYRNMRDIALTPVGHEVYDMARQMLEQANHTFTSVKSKQQDMTGEIRLFCPTSFGGFCITPWIAPFLAQHPGIRLKTTGTDFEDTDLVMGEADIVISSTRPEAREALHCQLLCTYPMYVYASQAYLDRRGVPITVRDLDHHQIIAWEDLLACNTFMHEVNALLYAGRSKNKPRTPYAVISTDMGIITNTLQGLGISLISEFLEDHFPSLECVPLEENGQLFQRSNRKYISYPKTLKTSRKHAELIRVIIDQATQKFGASAVDNETSA